MKKIKEGIGIQNIKGANFESIGKEDLSNEQTISEKPHKVKL